jgi:hypothetical protein
MDDATNNSPYVETEAEVGEETEPMDDATNNSPDVEPELAEPQKSITENF